MTPQIVTNKPDSLDQIANHEKKIAAQSSVLAAIFLTIMKLIIGLVTGSLGILSEALHSALDLFAAGVTYFAVYFAGKPADDEHPYGHGKIENISALFEMMLLLVTCIWIVYEAIQRLFFKSVIIESSIWSFIVMAIAIVIDVSRSKMLSRVARKHNSQALEADALHFSTDIWSSTVVICGLFLVFLSDKLHIPWLVKADSIAAIGVAGIVIYISFQLGRQAITNLIDEVSPALVIQITHAAKEVPLVIKVLEVRARHSGPKTYVDVTIALQNGTPLEKAHQVAEQVEGAVQTAVPKSSVMVHVDPVSHNTG
ncbi:cation transporter [Microgenomates group bacterium RBG_16_45_19]|nr:MAG: cation transporter [Microgenomates group bacterium RBG_16_45_19]